jgi:hypothetical protein
MIFALPILLAAATAYPSSAGVRAEHVMRVSVEIIKAEAIDPVQPKHGRKRDRPKTDRQYRLRDAMPMVEFY